MRTRNLEEAIDAVTRIYCPHTVEVTGVPGQIDAFLEVQHPTSQPLVSLSYSAPVKIDAHNFSRLFLMMHCSNGAAETTQELRTAEWRKGQTMPFSAGFDTVLWFDRNFVQRSIRLDMDQLERQCARWLGHPLDEPLHFALQPFSEKLEKIWQRTLRYLWSREDSSLALTGAARAGFDEYLLTLILQNHPHNYSEEIAEEVPTPIPRLIRRAQRFMVDHAEAPITVSDVAEHLGVSLRSLQAGFRKWREITPNTFLRRTRLQLVRDDLLRADKNGGVTAAALRHGFSHLSRFSAQYRSAFGEEPSATLRRGRGITRNSGAASG